MLAPTVTARQVVEPVGPDRETIMPEHGFQVGVGDVANVLACNCGDVLRAPELLSELDLGAIEAAAGHGGDLGETADRVYEEIAQQLRKAGLICRFAPMRM